MTVSSSLLPFSLLAPSSLDFSSLMMSLWGPGSPDSQDSCLTQCGAGAVEGRNFLHIFFSFPLVRLWPGPVHRSTASSMPVRAVWHCRPLTPISQRCSLKARQSFCHIEVRNGAPTLAGCLLPWGGWEMCSGCDTSCHCGDVGKTYGALGWGGVGG